MFDIIKISYFLAKMNKNYKLFTQNPDNMKYYQEYQVGYDKIFEYTNKASDSLRAQREKTAHNLEQLIKDMESAPLPIKQQCMHSIQETRELLDKLEKQDKEKKLTAPLASIYAQKLDMDLIIEFNQQDFKKCFDKAYPLLDHENELIVRKGLNWSLLALGQLKVNLTKEEYDKTMEENERKVIAYANNKKSKPFVANKVEYDGTRTAIAFLHYLSGNMDEVRYQIKCQISEYGEEMVKRAESNEKKECLWFFNNIDHIVYNRFLQDSLQISLTNKSKIKPR